MRQTLSRCFWSHSTGAGVLEREKQCGHTLSAVGFLVTFIALAMAAIALHLDRWSNIENDPALSSIDVEGYFGLYHYEFSMRNVTQVVNGTFQQVTITREGNMNGRSESTLCSNLRYPLEGEQDGPRDSCNQMLDACDDGSTFGIAAAVIGGFGTLWAAVSTYTLDFHTAQTPREDESKWQFCPRVSTGGIVFSLVAALMAFVGCWSYSDQRPGTADFFLSRALDLTSSVITPCTLSPVLANSSTASANCTALEDLLVFGPSACNATGSWLPHAHNHTCNVVGPGYTCQLLLVGSTNSTSALHGVSSTAVCHPTEPDLYLDTLDDSQAWFLMIAAGVVWLGAAFLLTVARCYKRVLNPMRNKTVCGGCWVRAVAGALEAPGELGVLAGGGLRRDREDQQVSRPWGGAAS